MNKRLAGIGIAVFIFVFLYFLPATPLVRNALLKQAQRVVQTQGYTLLFSNSHGNLWRNVSLSNASVAGDGVDVAIDTLAVRYNLLALVRGKLPLSVALDGVTGALTLEDIATPQGGGGGVSITPELRNVRVSDVNLSVNDVPYTLPDMAVERLTLSNTPSGYDVATLLSTPHGQADVSARVQLTPFKVVANVLSADASIAQAWWPGVKAGTLSGPLTIENNTVNANLSVQNGLITTADLNVSNIQGEINYAHPTISARLQGDALGAPLNAAAKVQLDAQQWQATINATPELSDIKTYVLTKTPLDPATIPANGSTTLHVEASGWQDVTLSATLNGNGSIANTDITDLQATLEFLFAGTADITAALNASVANQPFSATYTQSSDGLNASLNATALPVLESLGVGINANLRQVTGEAMLIDAVTVVSGEQLGREVQATINASVLADDVRVQLDAVSEQDESLQANARLQNGTLTANLSTGLLTLPVFNQAVQMSASATGPLTALPVTVTLSADAPLSASIAGLSVAQDLRGQASAVLTEGKLDALSLNFGALQANGSLHTSLNTGDVNFQLAPTPITGVINSSLSVQNGTLELRPEALQVNGLIRTDDVTAPGVVVPALVADAQLKYPRKTEVTANVTPASLEASVRAQDDSFIMSLTNNRLNAVFNAFVLSVQQQDVTVQGTAVTDLQDVQDASFDLRAASEAFNASLLGDAQNASLNLQAKLLEASPPLIANGVLNLNDRQANLNAMLGTIELISSTQLINGQLQGQSILNSNNERLTLELLPAGTDALIGTVRLQGTADLGTLADTFAVPVTGRLTSDLMLNNGVFTGQLQALGEAYGLPLDVHLQADDTRLLAAGDVRVLNEPVLVSGQVYPQLTLQLSHAFGVLTAEQTPTGLRVDGQGRVPAQHVASLQTNALAWQLSSDVSSRKAHLDIGASSVLADWRDGWQVNASINETLTSNTETLTLTATADISSTQPDGSIQATLLSSTPDALTLNATGSLQNLRVTGNAKANQLELFTPVSLPLAGDMALDARVDVLSGLTYDGELIWTPDTSDAPLLISASGSGSNVVLNATTDGLTARFQDNTIRVQASNFTPDAFITTPISGNLNGDLMYQLESGNWQGELLVQTGQPVVTRLRLNGVDDTLLLDGGVTEALFTARANGQLFPQPDLQVQASASEVVFLDARVSGTLAAPRVTGQVRTESLSIGGREGAPSTPSAFLPAQQFSFVSEPLGTRLLSLSGEQTTVLLTRSNDGSTPLQDAQLQGEVALEGLIENQAHAFTATLGGVLSNPEVNARLSGPYLSGPVVYEAEQGRATLSIDPTPWLASRVPAVIALSPVSASVLFSPDLAYVGEVTTTATIAASDQNLPVVVSAGFSGQAGAYTGTVTAAAQDESLPVSFSGQGANVTAQVENATVDLAVFAALVPFDLSGALTLNGAFRNETSPESGSTFKFEYAITTTGAIASQAFDLSVTGQPATPVSVSGTIANAALQASFSNALTFTLAYPQQTPALTLSGNTRFDTGVTLTAQGTYLEDALSVNASYQPDAQQATWQLRAGNAELSGQAVAQASPSANNWHVQSTLLAPQGNPFGLPAQAELSMRINNNQSTLETLLINTQLANTPTSLQLSGQLTPSLNLNGAANYERFELESFGLSVQQLPNGYRASVTQQALELRALLSSGFALQRFELLGDAVGLLGLLSVNADLGWSASAGYDGSALMRVTALDDAVVSTVALSGEGALQLRADVAYQGHLVANAQAQLDAVLTKPALRGEVNVNASVNDIVGAYQGEPLGLRAALTLDGTVFNPALAGQSRLEGAITAEGPVAFTAGAGSWVLAGDGLDFNAQFTDGALRGTLVTDDLPVAALTPYVDVATLSTSVTVLAGAKQAFDVFVMPLTLRLPDSIISGDLHYSPASNTLVGSANLDINAADITYGAQETLTGRLNGVIALTGTADEPQQTALSGALTATSLGSPNANAFMSGDINISGFLSAPIINASLVAEGNASGQLDAQINTRTQTYNIHSSVAFNEVVTDFVLAREENGFIARGQAALGEYGFVVAEDESTAERVVLVGNKKLTDWRVSVDLNAQTALLNGQLASLSDRASGDVSLLFDARALDGLYLAGDVINVQVAGLTLGNAQLSAVDVATRQLSIRGDRINAQLNAQNGLNWQLTSLKLPFNDTLSLSATASGTLNAASGTLTADINTANTTASIPLAITYNNRSLSVTTQTPILNGHLSMNVHATPETGWAGTLTATELELAGVRASVSGDVSGAFAAPLLDASLLVAQGASVLTSELQASASGVTVEGELRSPFVSPQLAFSGSLWPEASLVLRGSSGHRLQVTQDTQGVLAAEGRLNARIGPISINLASLAQPDELLTLSVEVPSVTGLGINATVPADSPQALLNRIRTNGVRFTGMNATSGVLLLRVSNGFSAELRALNWMSDLGSLNLNGVMRQQGTLSANLVAAWQRASNAQTTVAPWLASLSTVTMNMELDAQHLTIHSSGDAGTLDANYDRKTGNGSLTSNLRLGSGRLQGDVQLLAGVGPSGSLVLQAVPLSASPLFGDLVLSSELTLSPEQVSGSGRIVNAEGSASFEGALGWAGVLPEALAPSGSQERLLNARVDNFDVATLPVLSKRVPFLQAPVSGIVQLNRERIVGRLLSPNLRVLDTRLPTDLELNGTLNQVTLRGAVAGSKLNITYQKGEIAGLISLEQFPLSTIVEAVVGASGVKANVTGALRFDVPFNQLEAANVRFASERILIESLQGNITQGDVSVVYENNMLNVNRAIFEEAETNGRWQASGNISADALDFTLQAQNANFTPLLGLIPQLAAFDVGAEGSVEIQASGSLLDPVVTASSQGMNLSIGGSTYELNTASLNLENEQLRSVAQVQGIAPITGSVEIIGSGTLSLIPYNTENLQFELSGNANVPVFGDIKAFSGLISSDPVEGWQLNATADLGAPLEISGDLAPLTLHAEGRNLNIQSPMFFLESSQTDVDVDVRYENLTFIISGSVYANEAQVGFEGRDTLPQKDTTLNEPNRILQRVLLNDIRIQAPRQVRFQSNFGTAELGLDLLLAGSAAEPTLSGNARALRGSIVFSGQTFTLTNATANFEPSRGIFPTFNLNATTSYEKTRVLSNGESERIEFIEPKSSNNFSVSLGWTGEILAATDGSTGFTVDLETTLTSDAVIQERGTDVTSGARALSEAELYTLLTLGRLELTPNIVDQGGLASSVAQSAIDTAVDFLVLSELQNALSEALGVDLVEIRTSSLGSLIEGDSAEKFGVSLRIGGYLSEDVFASYSIGSLSDTEEDVALTNQFSLRYDLDPVTFNISGRVDFLDDAEFTPDTELDLSLGYAFSSITSIETGVNISNSSQSLRFGVNLRW